MSILRNILGLDAKRASTSVNADNVYSKLTYDQKLAALNLMMAFGGSCSDSAEKINKINHIMASEAQMMGVSSTEFHSATSRFSEIKDMSDALKDANREALAKLFWAFYCIIATGKNIQAVHVLLIIYKDYGFSEQDCLSILENRTGKKINRL